jgi:nucleoside-diphosphate-sugar epimerase
LIVPKGSGGADAEKPLTDDKLTMIAGDVTKKADVDKVFENDIDGVIVALGGKTKEVGDSMLTDGTNNIIQCMKEKGVKRIAVVTSIGAGDSEDQAPFFFKVRVPHQNNKLLELGVNADRHLPRLVKNRFSCGPR